MTAAARKLYNKKWMRRWRRSNPDKVLRYRDRNKFWISKNQEKTRKWSRQYARQFKAYLVSLRGGRCKDCKQKFPSCCFHFDHRVPAKKGFTISTCLSLPKVLKELKKCDMICANCHALRTFNSRLISEKIIKSKRLKCKKSNRIL